MPRPAHLLALGLALLVSLVIHGVFPDWFGALDNRFGDTLWNSAAQSASGKVAEQRIVVADIDEASIEAIGAWPWPRAVVAQLARTLFDRYHVKTVGLDIVFPEPGGPTSKRWCPPLAESSKPRRAAA